MYMRRTEDCTWTEVGAYILKNSSNENIDLTVLHFVWKGTSAVQQHQSQIRDFLDLCPYRQLKFDDSIYIIHAKWFVLFTEIPAVVLKCDVVALQFKTTTRSLLLLLLSRVIRRDWNYNECTSHFKMAACSKINGQNKSLIYRELSNYIQRIIKLYT